MKVVFTVFPETKDRDLQTEINCLPPDAEILRAVYEPEHLDAYYEILSQADAVISDFAPIRKEAIDRMQKCKIIALETTGFNFVDVEYAKSRGIAVTNVSGYCTQEVADHTLALILSLERRFPYLRRRIEEDYAWEMETIQKMGVHRIEGQTLGIIGFGKIGKAVAQRARSFGMKIVAYDPYVSKEVMDNMNVNRAELDELLEISDIISVHMNMTEDNEGLLNMDMFRKMKKQPFLINVARGGAVVEADLVQALDLGLVKGAALDVLESETPDLTKNPLLHRDNVILTPHTAFYSDEAYRISLEIGAYNARYYCEGKMGQVQNLL